MADTASATVTAPEAPTPQLEAMPGNSATIPENTGATGPETPEIQTPQPGSTTATIPEQPQQSGPVALIPQKRSGLGGIVDDFRNAVAGTRGSDVYINPETGEHFIQHPYLTGKQQWLKIGSEALRGAARGMAAGRGAGNMGRAAAAGLEGQINDDEKVKAQQTEDEQRNFANQRVIRMEKANSVMQAAQLAEISLKNGWAQVKGTQDSIKFMEEQNDYYGKQEGAIDLGPYANGTEIHKVKEKYEDVWGAHLKDNAIRPVPIYNADGTSGGVRLWYVPPGNGNEMLPAGTQLRHLVPDADPSKPGHVELFTPTGPVTRAQKQTNDEAFGIQLAKQDKQLNERNKTIAETGHVEAQKTLVNEEALNQPGIRAMNSATTNLKNEEAKTQQSVRDKNEAEAAKVGLEGGTSEAGMDLVDAIGTGHMVPERMSYFLSRNPALAAAVSKKYPGFDGGKAAAYVDMIKEFSTKKVAAQINSGGTALAHLKELEELNTPASHIPHSPAWTKYQNKAETVATELAVFYGTNTIPGIRGIRESLTSTLPGNRESAIQTQAQSMGDKFDSFENQWKQAAPSPVYEAKMPNLSEPQKDARAALDANYKNRRIEELGDNTRVQLPGYPAATMPRAAAAQFKKDHPTAKVLF
jgi:hypothetical protein